MSYYVYLLIDPRNKLPFYVGKGKGNRAQQHLWDISREHNKYKNNIIASIRQDGFEPKVLIACDCIEDEALAYDLEEHLIAHWGRKGYEDKGILSNVCPNARPPSMKGRTYEEIYGPERAKEQREKRNRLQRERGGYGPKVFSKAVRDKLSEMRRGDKHVNFGKQLSAETRSRISKAHTGKQMCTAWTYLLSSPNGIVYSLRGWESVKLFCRNNDLSYGTFHNNLIKGWPPSKRGKNVGWIITRKKED